MEKAEILWEDRSLLLCVKPVGLLSQPTETEEQSLLTLLQQEWLSTMMMILKL